MLDPDCLQQQEPPASEPVEALLDRVAASAGSALPAPRLLLVLAHPDDEVLAMGARLERLAQSRLLTVTDGAPTDGADARHHGFATLDQYRAARQEELRCALAHAGVSRAVLASLADGHAVPLPDQTAALHLSELTRTVFAALTHFRPEAVFTHPYEGGHPDHDACAFAVHAAVRLLGAQAGGRPPCTPQPLSMDRVPQILEAPFYHAGPDGAMRTGVFLHEVDPPRTRSCALSAAERTNKQARLACFASQSETLAQFSLDRETFRLAPAYHFAAPPHAGRLLYEHFPWGITGEHFRALAAAAWSELWTELTAAAGPNRPEPALAPLA